MFRFIRRTSARWLLAPFITAFLTTPLTAEEPARQFLEALREQGLFELANEYLQRVERSPATPQEFRDTILFEQGLTLMAVSRSESDFDTRQQRLDEAQKKFREFLTAQKNHDFAPKAKSQLANVLVERARVKIAEAERPKNAAQKPALLKEARKFYDQALEAATLAPAKHLGVDDRFGSVANGKVADLVILESNPLDDIRNTRTIRAVIRQGTVLDQDALSRLIESADPENIDDYASSPGWRSRDDSS